MKTSELLKRYETTATAKYSFMMAALIWGIDPFNVPLTYGNRVNLEEQLSRMKSGEEIVIGQSIVRRLKSGQFKLFDPKIG